MPKNNSVRDMYEAIYGPKKPIPPAIKIHIDAETKRLQREQEEKDTAVRFWDERRALALRVYDLIRQARDPVITCEIWYSRPFDAYYIYVSLQLVAGVHVRDSGAVVVSAPSGPDHVVRPEMTDDQIWAAVGVAIQDNTRNR